MSPKPHYEIYYLYHNRVFPQYYGNQIDQVTFVKMDKGSYIFPSKKHIHLIKAPWFKPIGKEWAEYEFYYSLYKGYLEGKVELPEYLGFIQYDMEFKGKEDRYKNTSIIDFIEELIEKKELHEKTLISFQPYDFEMIYNQHYILDPQRTDVTCDLSYENCLVTILRECNAYLYQNRAIDTFEGVQLSICGSFLLHRNVFIQVMEFLSIVIEDDRLCVFDKNKRYQGGMAERYIAIFLIFLDLEQNEFDVHHFGGYKKNTIREIGQRLKLKTPL